MIAKRNNLSSSTQGEDRRGFVYIGQMVMLETGGWVVKPVGAERDFPWFTMTVQLLIRILCRLSDSIRH